MTSQIENDDNRLERAITAWVFLEIIHSRKVGLSKTQFKKAIRIAMGEYTKIALKEADKY